MIRRHHGTINSLEYRWQDYINGNTIQVQSEKEKNSSYGHIWISELATKFRYPVAGTAYPSGTPEFAPGF